MLAAFGNINGELNISSAGAVISRDNSLGNKITFCPVRIAAVCGRVAFVSIAASGCIGSRFAARLKRIANTSVLALIYVGRGICISKCRLR